MKRLTVGLLLLVCCSLPALSQASVFEDIEASIPWAAGRTRISVSSGSDGARVTVRRSVTPWLAFAAVHRPENLFALQVKVLLVRELHPLSVAVDVGVDRLSLLSSLFFGPVGADIGRTWGARPARWAIAWLASHPQLTLAAGMEQIGDRIAPVIGIRWRPAWARWWGITLRAGSNGPEVSIGVGR